MTSPSLPGDVHGDFILRCIAGRVIWRLGRPLTGDRMDDMPSWLCLLFPRQLDWVEPLATGVE